MPAKRERFRSSTPTRSAVALLGLLAGGAGLAPAAHAETISLPANAFVQRCPCPLSGNVPDFENGVLVATDFALVYAAVEFPVNGQRICSLSMVYQDTNAGDALTARLLRKSLATGADPFASPAVLASVGSAAGVVTTVRKSSAKAGGSPVINDRTGAYYVEVSFPTINLNLLGVQIDYRPSCP